MKEPQLGQQVKDIITGFSGVVVAKTRYLHGVCRASVQPRDLKDGGIQKEQDFDLNQLSIVDEEIVHIVPENDPVVSMGDKVYCSMTEFQGIVWAICTYINGCRRMGVAPKVTKDNKIENQWFDEGQLRILRKNNVPQGPTNTGGPKQSINDSWK